MLVRPAFAILVSEYALTTVSRECGGATVVKVKTNQFGRLREDIGEDDLDAIQAAAYDFVARVENTYQDLLDPDMNWFRSLAEYQKLTHFMECVCSNEDVAEFEKKLITSSISQLHVTFGHFVRGLIIWRLNRQSVNVETNDHRKAEAYAKDYESDFENDIYQSMAEKEKVLTVFPWKSLRALDFRNARSNLLCEENAVFEQDANLNKKLATLHGVEGVLVWELKRLVDDVNKLILIAIQDHGYHGGVIPQEHFYSDFSSLSSDTSQNDVTESRTLDSRGLPTYKLSPRSPAQQYSAESTPQQPSTSKKTSINDSGQDYQDFLRLQDTQRQNDLDTASTTGVFNLAMRPAMPLLGVEEVPLLAKRPFLSDWPATSFPQSSRKRSIFRGEQTFGGLPLDDPFLSGDGHACRSGSTTSTLPYLLNRVSNVLNAGPSFLDTRHELDPRAEAITSHNEGLTTSIFVPNVVSNTPQSTNPAVTHDGAICQDSPFFSLRRFLDQIQAHTNGIAASMLYKGEELDFTVLTDTLLNIDEEQWKYLPMWAGGSNDGSGGVFGGFAPPAPVGAGPSGPGPSFHTGYSIGSRASTEIYYDGTSTVGGSVDTSVAVDNGFSDHIDRRKVLAESESDFHSEAFSDDTEKYDGNLKDGCEVVGKGKAKAADIDVNSHATTFDDTATHAITDDAEDAAAEKVEYSDDEFEWDLEDDEDEPFDFGEESELGDEI